MEGKELNKIVEEMKEKFPACDERIKKAKEIIGQDGSCSGLSCEDCFVDDKNDCFFSEKNLTWQDIPGFLGKWLEWAESSARQEAPKKGKDAVNNPGHYQAKDGSDIECIRAIRAMLTDAEWTGYIKGNISKYNWRAGHKNNKKEDFLKMKKYIDLYFENLKGEKQ